MMMMIHVIRFAHLRIALQKGNLEVGICEGFQRTRLYALCTVVHQDIF